MQKGNICAHSVMVGAVRSRSHIWVFTEAAQGLARQLGALSHLRRGQPQHCRQARAFHHCVKHCIAVFYCQVPEGPGCVLLQL